jgi:hypothetical protein
MDFGASASLLAAFLIGRMGVLHFNSTTSILPKLMSFEPVSMLACVFHIPFLACNLVL